MTETAYSRLQARVGRIGALHEVGGLLHWDMATNMPAGGADARDEQLAAIKIATHALFVDAETAELIAGAQAETGLDDWQKVNLGLIKKNFDKARVVPERLIEAMSRASHCCEMAWRRARPEADFQAVLKPLEEVLALSREMAAAKASVLGTGLYDALLDDYEPGGRGAHIDTLFADLATFLPEMTGRILEAQASRPAPLPLPGPFPTRIQRRLARRFMAALGFDFDHGRLDESLHPFCGGVPDDVRITTRWDKGDFASGLMGVLHETGHALYERGLPKEWRRQPVGLALGMSLHESQSLLVEMQVCRSRAFQAFAAPLIKEAFNGEGPAWEPDNFYALQTRVEAGFIRVDADEVTYPAHVIVRYRLERALIEGDLGLAELPGAWNDAMQELLGIRPPDDRLGCLQDIHWFDGAWGYFPTYTLGALAAAQLFEAARSQDPAIETAIEAGDFNPLFGWLGPNVHAQGSRFTADELMTRATGRPLDTAAFRRHLERRYLA